ncbi:MAG: hypothetical protein AAFV26_02545 [Pseudomonadota bacterium]
MVTVEGLIFGVLGFLVAGMLAVLFAPLFWARAVRLTTEDIKRSIPMTEAEISAERGLLKAKHAIELHALTTELEDLKRSVAIGRVDVNRRDASILALQRRIDDLEATRETNDNARRVLERTLTERVPEAERELRAAQAALRHRDDELLELRQKSDKALIALDEAIQLNETQRQEIEGQKTRLSLKLAQEDVSVRPETKQAAANEAELNRLRIRVREQSQLIARLQKAEKSLLDHSARKSAAPPPAAAATTDSDREREADLLKLRADLKRAEGRLDDRDREVRALKAEIAAHDELGAGGANGGSETTGAGRTRSITADRARLAALEKLSGDQEETIGRLRAELSAANERLARQAAHFMDELRRLGAPTLKRGEAAATPTDPARERIGGRRRSSSLTQRIRETLVDEPAEEAPGDPPKRAPVAASPAPAEKPAETSANGVGARLRNRSGNDAAEASVSKPDPQPAPTPPSPPSRTPPAPVPADAAASEPGSQVSLKGLVARISNLEKRS